MEVITFLARKGGVGKSTLAFNFSEWLSQQQHKKTLLIDLDSQQSLTDLYREKVHFSEDDIFKNGSRKMFLNQNETIEPIKIKKNLYFIPSDSKFSENILTSSDIANKEMLLLVWKSKNKQLLEQFDYVIFDLPPAYDLITKNAVAVSDKIISPMQAGKFDFNSRKKVLTFVKEMKEQLINPINSESFVNARTYFIGNKIEHNTKSSSQFKEAIEKFDDILFSINKKELINRSTLDNKGVFEFAENNSILSKNKDFFEDLNEKFKIIKNI